MRIHQLLALSALQDSIQSRLALRMGLDRKILVDIAVATPYFIGSACIGGLQVLTLGTIVLRNTIWFIATYGIDNGHCIMLV